MIYVDRLIGIPKFESSYYGYNSIHINHQRLIF